MSYPKKLGFAGKPDWNIFTLSTVSTELCADPWQSEQSLISPIAPLRKSSTIFGVTPLWQSIHSDAAADPIKGRIKSTRTKNTTSLLIIPSLPPFSPYSYHPTYAVNICLRSSSGLPVWCKSYFSINTARISSFTHAGGTGPRYMPFRVCVNFYSCSFCLFEQFLKRFHTVSRSDNRYHV